MDQYLQKNEYEFKNPTPMYQEEKPDYNPSKISKANIENTMYNGKKIENNVNIYQKPLPSKSSKK